MGSIIKKPSGVYEAQVARKGIRKSSTFRTKAEANMWIAETEKEIIQGKYGVTDKTFGDLMERYGQVVSSTKRGEEWELKKIGSLLRDPIAKIKLSELNQTHFADWRDRRLQTVTDGTVLREWNLITHALNISMREWRWISSNPIQNVRKPKAPLPRTRRIAIDELNRILYALGYDYQFKSSTVSFRVACSLLFAIETTMRAGEIVSLTWDNVNLEKRVAKLPMTKNGFARDVPLSTEAIRILNQVKEDTESVFNLTSGQIDSLFRKAKKRALIDDLHFHDSRAEGITRLAQKVDILTLARISGHRDLRMLQIYYRESAEDIAKKL